ncbi:hypothetical protein RD792_015375 [Penstemon davidsonii]|uniref:Carbohydrate kinase PfkB domain-containing protein n=1 Tax=Penstemon davidsonii TaxID=160366 RepID=A0ABR0CTF3_9LAMI|nr:hypothetical protein RD792_015375 [Penstemon davidsonii]
MTSMSFAQFSLLPRWDLSLNRNFFPHVNLLQIQDSRLNKKVVTLVSRNKITDLAQDASDGEAEGVDKKTRKTTKRASTRTRKKGVLESPDEISAVNENVNNEEVLTSTSLDENLKKTRSRARKKVPSSEEESTEKVIRRRRTRKKADEVDSEEEFSDHDGDTFATFIDEESELELELDIDNGEDTNSNHGWPPLVCCFGAAQHAFVPSGRQANRLIDYEMHERMRDALWEPEKFVRACGGCSSNVAVALANLGGKAAFMGKVGDDFHGLALLLYLSENEVQTKSVCIDDKRATAVSSMKIGKRGGLRMISRIPCAEDCLSSSEIDIDVLKEAKMFYFNTFSLLDPNMRSTAYQAIKISKKLGNVVFYDVNLPLPLWQSSEETGMFIQRAWNLSNIIEVTKQELEFLCGIIPSEKFDTRDNNRSKFIHYPPEMISQLWHDDLKILFVTNGTSKIHYYTKEHNGAVYGMEDAPLTPYTSDMSASGDGIVAGIMKMLTVHPHLMTDKGYLEHTIKYAINCGVVEQWKHARSLGFPAKEGMENVVSDPNGIKSITEREYRTLIPSTK